MTQNPVPKPKILCDVDGVLLNWSEAFHAWMFHIGFPIVDETAHGYSLCQAYGITDEQIVFLIDLFNCSENSTDLEAFRDAQKYVKLLHKEGFQFEAITAFGGNKYTVEGRRKNLQRLFGNAFTKVHFVPMRASKTNVLQQYITDQPTPIWVEDHVINANEGAELGFRTLLMDHAYNKDENRFERVKNWQQLYQLITTNAN